MAHQMSMGPRLLAGLLATFLAVFASAGVGLWAMGDIRRQVHFVESNSLQSVEIIDRLAAGLDDRKDARLGIIEATDLGARANFTRRFYRANREIGQAMEDYAPTVVDVRDAELFAALGARLMEYNTLASSVSTERGATAARADLLATQPQFDALRGALLAVRNNNLAMARRAVVRADAAETKGRMLLVLAALLAGAIGIVVAEVVTVRRVRAHRAAHARLVSAAAQTAAAADPPDGA